MKRIVLTFGLIAGAILSIMMLITLPFHDRIGYDNGMILGYTTMVVAFMMVFFGIKSYRENVANGEVTFGRAFKVGVMIMGIASVCYVLTWEVLYYNVIGPEWSQKMIAEMMENERKDGKTEAELAAKQAEITRNFELYKNPLFNMAFTFVEVLPVGLIVTTVSAAILRRRKDNGSGALAQAT